MTSEYSGRGGRIRGMGESEEAHHSKSQISSISCPRLYTKCSKSKCKNSLSHKMALIDKDRLLRLQRAAKSGTIVRSDHGVFELDPCNECGFHHKLSLSLKKQAPCPATDVGKIYYGRHPKEKLNMENFPLNKVLQKSIQTLPSQEKPTQQPRKTSSSRCMPKVVRSEEVMSQLNPDSLKFPRSSSTTIQPRPSKVKNRVRSFAETPQNNSFVDSLTWNDVFLESQLSSSTVSTDTDSKDHHDTDNMRRQLLREMFTQEEEALRLRLAKDKDNYLLAMKALKTKEKERALAELRSGKILDQLKKYMCILMEQDIILGVAKVTLDNYYQQYRVHTRESALLNRDAQQNGSQPKLAEDLKREYLEYLTSKENKLIDSQCYQKALEIMKKRHEATPKISELKMAELELQQRLSFTQKAKYQQQISVSKQQAELEQKVSEARKLEKELLQLGPQSISSAKHEELRQKISEAKLLQQNLSAKQAESQNRELNQRHLLLQQKLSEVRKLREQLSIERQADLQRQFSIAKKAELIMKGKSSRASMESQSSVEEESRQAAMKLDKLRHDPVLQNLLQDTLLIAERLNKGKPGQQAKGNSEQLLRARYSGCSQDLKRSKSAPRSQKLWPKMAAVGSPAESISSKFALNSNTEKAVQTTVTLPNSFDSSSSTQYDSSSTDERGHYPKGGPTAISPRPPSAHHMRRPEFYARQRQRIAQEEEQPTWSAATTSSNIVTDSLAQISKDTSRASKKEAQPRSRPSTVATPSESYARSKEFVSHVHSREGAGGIMENTSSAISGVCSSASHERKISFMVSLPMGKNTREIRASQVSMGQTSLDSEYSLTDENTRLCNKLEASMVGSAKIHSHLPQEFIIDNAREGSSLISHVDSLILIEQGVPEPPPTLTAEESQEVIEKVQAESCIVQHVDSLILIDQSLHQLDEAMKKAGKKLPDLSDSDFENEIYREEKFESSAPKMIPASEVIIKKESDKAINEQLTSEGGPSGAKKGTAESLVAVVSPTGIASPKSFTNDSELTRTSAANQTPSSDASFRLLGSEGKESGLIAPPSTPIDGQQLRTNAELGSTLASKVGPTSRAYCMADIQRELKQLEEAIAALPITRLEKAELPAVENLQETYTSIFKDKSADVPQIMVSPALSSLTDLEAQQLLRQAQEYAKGIIATATEINTRYEFPDAEFAGVNALQDSTESQILLHARELVCDIIDTAKEITNTLYLVDTEGALSLAGNTTIGHNDGGKGSSIAGSIGDSGREFGNIGKDPMQAKAFEMARKLVCDAVRKSVEINANVSSVQADSADPRSSRGGGEGLRTIESQMTVFKAQEIVNRLIEHATRMMINKLQTEYFQTTLKTKTEEIEESLNSSSTAYRRRSKQLTKQRIFDSSVASEVKKGMSEQAAAGSTTATPSAVATGRKFSSPKANRDSLFSLQKRESKQGPVTTIGARKDTSATSISRQQAAASFTVPSPPPQVHITSQVSVESSDRSSVSKRKSLKEMIQSSFRRGSSKSSSGRRSQHTILPAGVPDIAAQMSKKERASFHQSGIQGSPILSFIAQKLGWGQEQVVGPSESEISALRDGHISSSLGGRSLANRNTRTRSAYSGLDEKRKRYSRSDSSYRSFSVDSQRKRLSKLDSEDSTPRSSPRRQRDSRAVNVRAATARRSGSRSTRTSTPKAILHRSDSSSKAMMQRSDTSSTEANLQRLDSARIRTSEANMRRSHSGSIRKPKTPTTKRPPPRRSTEHVAHRQSWSELVKAQGGELDSNPDLYQKSHRSSTLPHVRRKSISASAHSGLDSSKRKSMHSVKRVKSATNYSATQRPKFSEARTMMERFHMLSRRARRKSSWLFGKSMSSVSLPDNEIMRPNKKRITPRYYSMVEQRQSATNLKQPSIDLLASQRQRSTSANPHLKQTGSSGNVNDNIADRPPLKFIPSQNAKIQMRIQNYDNSSESTRSIDLDQDDDDPYDITNNLPDIHDISYINLNKSDHNSSIDYLLEQGQRHSRPRPRRRKKIKRSSAHKSKSEPNWNSDHEVKDHKNKLYRIGKGGKKHKHRKISSGSSTSADKTSRAQRSHRTHRVPSQGQKLRGLDGTSVREFERHLSTIASTREFEYKLSTVDSRAGLRVLSSSGGAVDAEKQLRPRSTPISLEEGKKKKEGRRPSQ